RELAERGSTSCNRKGNKSESTGASRLNTPLSSSTSGSVLTSLSFSLSRSLSPPLPVKIFREQELNPTQIASIRHRRYLLLPLNRCRRFGTDVIHYSVYAFYVIDDLVGNPGQQFVRQMTPICGHPVQRLHGTQSDHIFIGPFVPHDAHGLYRQKYGTGLPYLMIPSRFFEGIEVNGICFLQDGDLFRGHFPQDADGQPGPRERMTLQNGRIQPQGTSHFPYFVLK